MNRINQVVEKHAREFVNHAAEIGKTSIEVYRMSIVNFYHFIDMAVKAQDAEYLNTILYVIGEADSKQDFSISQIYKAVSDVIEEAEQEEAALSEPPILEEWETEERKHELREFARMQAVGGWHHPWLTAA